MSTVQQNPLKKYFRQPKIYIRLPSSGNFYPPGSLEMTETGEFPVFPMTAKDELLIRTPDALMNGQATVDVIQSCMPNIKNAWLMPSIDVDAVLVAIRIATYGEMLDVTTVLPGMSDAKTYETDLRIVLDSLLSATFDPEYKVDDDMTVIIRPLNYKEFSQSSIKSLEEQRIIRLVNDESMEEAQKLQMFAQSFKKLTNLTIDTVSQGLERVRTPDGDVTDPAFIKEFIENADKTFFKGILDHLDEQKKKFAIRPFKVTTTDEERADGAPDEFEVPITLDSSNFFG